MSLLSLFPHTVTVTTVTDGALDADRNPIRATSTSEVVGRLEQVDAIEPGIGGVGLQERWRLFLPPTAVLGAADEVTVLGRRFTVVGTPDPVYARTELHHLEASLLYVGDVSQT